MYGWGGAVEDCDHAGGVGGGGGGRLSGEGEGEEADLEGREGLVGLVRDECVARGLDGWIAREDGRFGCGGEEDEGGGREGCMTKGRKRRRRRRRYKWVGELRC